MPAEEVVGEHHVGVGSVVLDRSCDVLHETAEQEVLGELRRMADQNVVARSYIGMGYYGTITPPVIQRNILENPGWYTQYTPYQPEIAQGRLEALINFQTMITDLTGMEIANSSLLDEGTAAAEAMTLCQRAQPRNSTANTFFISELCHPQTVAVVQTRAKPLGINIVIGDHEQYDFGAGTFGVLLQYPATNGDILDYGDFVVHVFTEERRAYYGLDGLWGDAPTLDADDLGIDPLGRLFVPRTQATSPERKRRVARGTTAVASNPRIVASTLAQDRASEFPGPEAARSRATTSMRLDPSASSISASVSVPPISSSTVTEPGSMRASRIVWPASVGQSQEGESARASSSPSSPGSSAGRHRPTRRSG